MIFYYNKLLSKQHLIDGTKSQEETNKEGEEDSERATKAPKSQTKNSVIVLRIDKNIRQRHQKQAEKSRGQHGQKEHFEHDQNEGA